MHLFTVEETFLIPNSGLPLTPGLDKQAGAVNAGSMIRLIFPDQTHAETTIKGMFFKITTSPFQ